MKTAWSVWSIPVVIAGALLTPASAFAQTQTFTVNENPPTAPSAVERLSPTVVRIGNVTVDTGKKEVSVRGIVGGAANVIEFIAVTKGGYKAYESALELDTTAINFNVGLILIGLDQARSKVPKVHLDPASPAGDPVEVWVEWGDENNRRKVRAEELVYNTQSKETLTKGPWVYTGSMIVQEKKALLADIDGPLIAFAHTPSAVIDSPRSLGGYGNEVLNPSFALKPGTPVVVTVRALPRPKP